MDALERAHESVLKAAVTDGMFGTDTGPAALAAGVATLSIDARQRFDVPEMGPLKLRRWELERRVAALAASKGSVVPSPGGDRTVLDRRRLVVAVTLVAVLADLTALVTGTNLTLHLVILAAAFAIAPWRVAHWPFAAARWCRALHHEWVHSRAMRVATARLEECERQIDAGAEALALAERFVADRSQLLHAEYENHRRRAAQAARLLDDPHFAAIAAEDRHHETPTASDESNRSAS